MEQERLEVSLFGTCVIRISGPEAREITGSKHKAIIALLATAPMGRRTRAFLQETLWGDACFDGGRQSLRRALSDLRRAFGPLFDRFFTTNNTDVILRMEKVEFLTGPRDGPFLEGMDIREQGFNDWLIARRLEPIRLCGLTESTKPPLTLQLAPVISVIPFQLMQGDRVHRHLGDWLAQDICRSLSRSNFLAVISHLSSRELNKRALSLAEIRENLASDYTLLGAMRIVNDLVVLDLDFLDIASGQIMWTRRFEGSLSGIREMNEQMTGDVVNAIGKSVIRESIGTSVAVPVNSVADHKLLIAGVSLMHRQTLSSFSRGRVFIEEAIRRVPQKAELHAWLAKWYILSVINGWTHDATGDKQKAVDLTARALDLDPECPLSLTIDGFAHNNLLKDLDIASMRYRKALDINPNEALSWVLKGTLHAFSNDASTGVSDVERAHRLSPLDPFGYFYDSLRATTYLADDQFDRALQLAEKSYQKNKRHASTLRVKIAALHALERFGEARAVAQELMRHQPDFTVSGYLRTHPAADYPIGRQMADAMIEAGIPN